MRGVLGSRVMEVKFTDRLVSSPAVATSVLSPHMRRMMKQMMAQSGGGSSDDGPGSASSADSALVPMTLEVSAKHAIVKTLFSIKESNPQVANAALESLFDNACIAAGMLDEPRTILGRSNKLLEMLVYQGAGFDYQTNAYRSGSDAGDASAANTATDTTADAATDSSTKSPESTASTESGKTRLTEATDSGVAADSSGAHTPVAGEDSGSKTSGNSSSSDGPAAASGGATDATSSSGGAKMAM